MFFDYRFDCAQRHTDHGIAGVGTRVFWTASPGSPHFTSSLPATHPYNSEDGSDLDSQDITDLDLAFNVDNDSEKDATFDMAAPDFHFANMTGESGSNEWMI